MLSSAKVLVYVGALSLALMLVMDTGGLTSGLRAIYYFLEDGMIDDHHGNQLHNRSNKVRVCSRTSHTRTPILQLTHHTMTHTSPLTPYHSPLTRTLLLHPASAPVLCACTRSTMTSATRT